MKIPFNSAGGIWQFLAEKPGGVCGAPTMNNDVSEFTGTVILAGCYCPFYSQTVFKY